MILQHQIQVTAFTGISGSTGELYADSTLTLEPKTRLSFQQWFNGNQSGSIELRADGLFPSVKPAVDAQPAGSYSRKQNLQSGTYNSQLITILGTGSQHFLSIMHQITHHFQ